MGHAPASTDPPPGAAPALTFGEARRLRPSARLARGLRRAVDRPAGEPTKSALAGDSRLQPSRTDKEAGRSALPHGYQSSGPSPAQPSSAQLGPAQFGPARPSSAQLGPARPGSARPGLAQLGSSRPSTACPAPPALLEPYRPALPPLAAVASASPAAAVAVAEVPPFRSPCARGQADRRTTRPADPRPRAGTVPLPRTATTTVHFATERLRLTTTVRRCCCGAALACLARPPRSRRPPRAVTARLRGRRVPAAGATTTPTGCCHGSYGRHPLPRQPRPPPHGAATLAACRCDISLCPVPPWRLAPPCCLGSDRLTVHHASAPAAAIAAPAP